MKCHNIFQAEERERGERVRMDVFYAPGMTRVYEKVQQKQNRIGFAVYCILR